MATETQVMIPAPFRAVAVIGAGACDDEVAADAREVGRLLALEGLALVCGGLGGVMEAACEGAYQAGGLTIGILPGANPLDANAYVRVPIATGLGEARNALVVRTADVVIAIGGEYGTLSEIGFARKLGKLVVGIGTWELDHPTFAGPHVLLAGSAEEAVRAVAAVVKTSRG